MSKSFYITLLLVCFVFALQAQQRPDSVTNISAWTIDRETKNPVAATIDTSMMEVRDYNPVFENSFSNTFLGNSGQAYLNNKFYQRNNTYPFFFAFPFQVYMYDPYKIKHFNTQKPYTQIGYNTFGSKENSEQVLSALHTQNMSPKANIGIFYDLIASRGIYNNQEANANRLNLFGSYRGDKYSMYASAHSNSMKQEENGGLTNLESFFEHNLDEANYSVYLSNANSRMKNYSVFITQKYVPGKRSRQQPDSLVNVPDSLNSIQNDTAGIPQLRDSLSFRRDTARQVSADTIQRQIYPPKRSTENFIFQHTMHYSRYMKTYSDEYNRFDTLNFYKNTYYVDNRAHDSAFYQELENRLDLSFRFAKGSQELRAWARHQYRSYSYDYPQPVSFTVNPVIDSVIALSRRESFNDISVGGLFMGNLGNWEYQTRGEIYLTGYRQSDVMAGAHFTRYFTGKKRAVRLSGKISSFKPDYFLMNYESTHFIWHNDFNNTDNIEVKFEFFGKNDLKIEAVMNYLTGYIYFDNDAMPVQFKDQMVVPSVFIEKTFAWGPVRQQHKILWQKPSSDILHLPDLAYGNSTWYQNEVFNKVLKFQIGFRFYYFTNYYTDAWMPATGTFYRQTDRKTGNYPYIDGFLNWSLKRTRFSLQYTNALAGIAGYDYFMAYRHPVFNSALRFGLSWTFYD